MGKTCCVFVQVPVLNPVYTDWMYKSASERYDVIGVNREFSSIKSRLYNQSHTMIKGTTFIHYMHAVNKKHRVNHHIHDRWIWNKVNIQSTEEYYVHEYTIIIIIILTQVILFHTFILIA